MDVTHAHASQINTHWECLYAPQESVLFWVVLGKAMACLQEENQIYNVTL